MVWFFWGGGGFFVCKHVCTMSHIKVGYLHLWTKLLNRSPIFKAPSNPGRYIFSYVRMKFRPYDNFSSLTACRVSKNFLWKGIESEMCEESDHLQSSLLWMKQACTYMYMHNIFFFILHIDWWIYVAEKEQFRYAQKGSSGPKIS